MSTKRFDKLESFSNYFKVSNEDIERLGFFDVTLDFDSQLYIDSKLLTDYNAPHFLNASSMLKEQFTDLIRLLRHARTTDCSDMFWKEADKRLTFTELHGTCLGYSSNGIIGKAIGKKLRKNVLTRIWTLIQEGKDDPEIFELVCVFTEQFGCDRTSDLVTHMIREVIFEYNESIIEELKLNSFPLIGYQKHKLLQNPYRPKNPILLLPKSILSDLPVCFDFDDIEYAVMENEEARLNLQKYIDFNQPYTKNDIFKAILNDEEVYKSLIKTFKKATGKNYNFDDDPKCCYKFRDILHDAYLNHEEAFLEFDLSQPFDIVSVTEKCISLFKHLVEDCGLRSSVYKFDEKGSQHLFYATSYYYCSLHQIALCPEANSGRGPVDFFLTNGSEKISVELKKTSHQKYVEGLTKQLPEYMKSNDSTLGYYLLLNVDSKETRKIKRIMDARNSLPDEYRDRIKVEIIEAFPIPSASKL